MAPAKFAAAPTPCSSTGPDSRARLPRSAFPAPPPKTARNSGRTVRTILHAAAGASTSGISTATSHGSACRTEPSPDFPLRISDTASSQCSGNRSRSTRTVITRQRNNKQGTPRENTFVRTHHRGESARGKIIPLPVQLRFRSHVLFPPVNPLIMRRSAAD